MDLFKNCKNKFHFLFLSLAAICFCVLCLPILYFVSVYQQIFSWFVPNFCCSIHFGNIYVFRRFFASDSKNLKEKILLFHSFLYFLSVFFFNIITMIYKREATPFQKQTHTHINTSFKLPT